MGTQIAFYTLAAIIVVSSILAVTAKKMMRAATYLLFVLIATAGLYLLLEYEFLFAVQLTVYAGGILVLFIFAILLTSANSDRAEPGDRKKIVSGLVTALAGVVITTLVTVKHKFLYAPPVVTPENEITMEKIGHALMGTGRFQYVFAFEILSILLLTCAIGGILIARKR
ncbi:MAG: NADH-quinone oxidoreductase subunit J [Rikenellaceae bacterium]|jgi:NADH-quinone oxidoreductase subunit J|nr:NADH-quinone oxidoreductase subunit J [Rikenellaceae bacterium]